ncbi:MAG: hypothetical protein Q7T86_17170 [Hyphomicrobiaceae bacterium]|nr:hypothetical protein [Hyphomicrobiaceae bacterium]
MAPGKKQGRGGDEKKSPALRDRISTDRLLQQEITVSLEHLADHLPHVSNDRLPRMLFALLEFSWAEHVSFQRDALFPILRLSASSRSNIDALIDRLEVEHVEISDRHIDVQEHIGNLLDGSPSPPDVFGYALRNAFEARRRHMDGEAELAHWLPPVLAPADAERISRWQSSRADPPFPLNVLYEKR